ncbi:MAG: toprim domain-containing protein [Macromonas sp.]
MTNTGNSSLSLTAQARGRWAEIFSGLAPEFSDAIEVAHLRKHITCPVHGTSSRSGHGNGFRVMKDWADSGGVVCNTCGVKNNGFLALAWLRGWDIKEAAREVSRFLKSGEIKPVEQRVVTKHVSDDEWAKRKIEEVRRLGKSAEGTPVELYLRNRGLTLPVPDTLRYVPNLSFWDAETRKETLYPGMIADVVTADGLVRSVHRTYLTAEGKKAPLENPKKVMSPIGTISGGAIELYGAKEGEWLSVSEGIETALAVRQALGLPVWATVSATMMAKLNPDMWKHVKIKGLLIWADLDVGQEILGGLGAGEWAALELQQRMCALGIPCHILIPGDMIPNGAKGVDWLDVYRSAGAAPLLRHLKNIQKVRFPSFVA